MKNQISVSFFPKNFTLLGISYDLGEATNIQTNEVFPIYKVSVGLLFVIIDFIITKKG